MVWTENFRINSHDCDCNGIVKASAVLRYMQETAGLQMLKFGPSHELLRKQGKAFLLSRVNMGIYSPLYAYDDIKVETWACEGHGASFTRCARIYKNDSVIAELHSVFALVDIVDRRILSFNDVQFDFSCDGKPLELDLPTRIRIPKDMNMALCGEYTVTYGDVDQNYHMNNTNYPDMLANFLPDVKDNRIVKISINFHNEAPLNMTVKVYRGENDDGTFFFRTLRDDGNINVEAIVVTDII